MRRDKAGVQYSPEFEREGDRWRLELSPNGPADQVELAIRLMSVDKPSGYSVDRCFQLCLLHPTEDWACRTQGSSEPHRFRMFGAWTGGKLQSEDVSQGSYKGFVALQATLWKPPPPQDEQMADAKPICSICMTRAVSCLVPCCKAVKACDSCMQRQLKQRSAKCPWCRASLSRNTIVFGIKM